MPGQAAEKKREIKSGIDPRIGEKVTEVTQPMISIYSPPKDLNNGAAVVICPGGGYHILAYDLEGTEVARWLNSIGVTGVVLHYRVPRAKGRPKHELPLMDLQRAISVVRFSSKELGIDLNARDSYGKTVFMYACSFGELDMMELMMNSSKEFEIDLNARHTKAQRGFTEHFGNTAFIFACIRGQTEAVKLMIENRIEFGIDITKVDNRGKNPLKRLILLTKSS